MDETGGSFDDVWSSIADALWAGYPYGPDRSLLEASETFPAGTLLGRFRLDPLDPGRSTGIPVDVLSGEGGDDLARVRSLLGERSLRAALVSDEMVDSMLDAIEETCEGAWDEPWRLYGLVPSDVVSELSLPAVGSETVAAVLLVPVGAGHPADGLESMIAPPCVFGLVLANEGYARDDAGRRIGEVRMQMVVLADGRWGMRTVHRRDSRWRPFADSTVGGKPVTTGDLVDSDREVFGSEPNFHLAGTVPEALARVLQVAVRSDVDPFETMLRLLARSAVPAAVYGVPIEDLARVDPAVLAWAGSMLIEHLGSASEAAPLSEEEAVAGVEEIVSTLVRAARAASEANDWLDDVMLAGITREGALHAVAGSVRAVDGIDDTTAAWLGSELLAGRAAERAGPVADSLAAAAEHDLVLAQRLADLVRHRREVWGIEDDDGARLAVVLGGRGRPGRNDRCPCGSGRKYKQCCMDDTSSSS